MRKSFDIIEPACCASEFVVALVVALLYNIQYIFLGAPFFAILD